MSEHNFRLLLDVDHDLIDADLNALYEATGSDATFGSDDDGWSAEFDREAPNYATAVLTAAEQLEGAGVGLRVRRLVSDEDALVSAAEIASRTRLSRQAVNLYAAGERNRELGPFPTPVVTFASGQRIWRWGDVIPWLSKALGRDLGSEELSETVAALNDVLDLRRRLPHVPAGARKVMAQALERELAGAASR